LKPVIRKKIHKQIHKKRRMKMTAQMAEVLVFEGETHPMMATPLADYFQLGGHDPGFQATSTALWRGYVGRWEIIDARLYLTQLSGYLRSGAEASIGSVFPGFEARVFAHWFSGTIRLPMGKLINYVHGGFASRYERDLLLKIDNGVLVAKTLRHNGEAPKDAKEGYTMAAMTTLPVNKKTGGES
jgi:hypothetical protein